MARRLAASMHVPDGLLSTGVWVGGGVVAAAGVGLSLRRFDAARAPALAVVTSLFFVVSSIHVPVGVTSVHLILNGLAGILLGRLALPCILVALFYQRLLFVHGGFQTLGVNTVIQAGGAWAAYVLFRFLGGNTARRASFAGFVAGAAAVLVSIGLFIATMYTGGAELRDVGFLIVLPHAVLAGVEGLVTASAVVFIYRVKPDLLHRVEPSAPAREEGR